MKRSEINRAIRMMEKLAGENGFCLPPFCNWSRRIGKIKGMNMMRYEIICLDGILQIMAVVIGRKWVSRLLHSEMVTRITLNIKRFMLKSF